jgi:hypothetical protein
MAFFRKLFKGPRAYASTMPSFYGRWGEPKPLDQLRLLELAEGDAEVRACLDATVDAVTANGWYVTGLDEAKNAAELWLREHEDEFLPLPPQPCFDDACLRRVIHRVHRRFPTRHSSVDHAGRQG